MTILRIFTGLRIIMLVPVMLSTLAILSACVTTALAGDTLRVSVASSAPEQGVPLAIEISGVSEAVDAGGDGPRLSAVIRPAGGIGCQATFANDHSAAGGVTTELVGPRSNQPSEGPGPYSQAITYNPPNIGTYQVCAWLETLGEPGSTVAGPVSATFSAGAPHIYQLSVGLPRPALPGVAFQISYTTHTDQQLHMNSVIRPSGGLPCAAYHELDSEQDKSETSLIGDSFSGNSNSVFGGPITITATATEPAGPYLICTWIEGPNDNEVDASNATNIYVGTPPPPPPPLVHAVSPHLSLRTVRVSKRHGTVVEGKGAGALTGHMRVGVSCARASVQSDVRVVRGRFGLKLSTPRGCRHGGRAHVIATWPGSRRFSKQSVSDTVKVAR